MCVSDKATPQNARCNYKWAFTKLSPVRSRCRSLIYTLPYILAHIYIAYIYCTCAVAVVACAYIKLVLSPCCCRCRCFQFIRASNVEACGSLSASIAFEIFDRNTTLVNWKSILKTKRRAGKKTKNYSKDCVVANVLNSWNSGATVVAVAGGGFLVFLVNFAWRLYMCMHICMCVYDFQFMCIMWAKQKWKKKLRKLKWN